MGRGFLLIGVIFISFLMISSATAVPKVYSDPLIEQINKFEEYKELIECKISDINIDGVTNGLIDLLIKIIQWIISLVQQIIDIVLDLFGIIDLIEYLISLIVYLFELILSLIDAIFEIFNPAFPRTVPISPIKPGTSLFLVNIILPFGSKSKTKVSIPTILIIFLLNTAPLIIVLPSLCLIISIICDA